MAPGRSTVAYFSVPSPPPNKNKIKYVLYIGMKHSTDGPKLSAGARMKGAVAT